MQTEGNVKDIFMSDAALVDGGILPLIRELGVYRGVRGSLRSLRDRIQRITELLADDVQSADTRTQLWLAIRARELLAIRSRAGASLVDSRWSSTTAASLSNWMQPEGTTDGCCFPGPKHAPKPQSCVGTPLHR